MGLLGRLSDVIVKIGGAVLGGIKTLFGIRPKPPALKIQAALRKQWLDLAPEEPSIPGVEYEGEIYYETPK